MPRRSWRNLFGLLPSQRAADLSYSPMSGFFGGLLPGSDIDPNPIGSKREALQSYIGWVFAAASLISEDVRSTGWDLWRKTGKSREDWTAVADNPALSILRRPNEQQTWGTLIETSDLHYSLSGEAFWEVLTRNQEPGGAPVGLQIIYPHWVDRPVIERGRLVGWRIIPPGLPPRTIAKEDFIRIYRPHPLEPLQAASPVEAFAVSHYMDLYFRAYGMTLMRNDSGVPAGIISTDQILTQKQADDYAERWRQKYGQRRGEISVLGQGTKYQGIALPLQDVKFLELGQFTREQILGIYRVPAAVLGIVTDSNRANSEAAMVAYQRQALAPRLQRYQEAINTFLLPRLLGASASGFAFEFENPVDEDEGAKAKRAGEMLSAGAITVNEYREMLGQNPTPSGDVFMVANKVTPRASLTPEPEPSEGAPRAQPPVPDVADAVDRIALAAVQRDNRRLRIEAAERKHYNDLRGLFARFHREAKAGRLPDLDTELAARSIDRTQVAPRVDEDPVEYFERLKSEVAKTLARELAEREVDHGTRN